MSRRGVIVRQTGISTNNVSEVPAASEHEVGRFAVRREILEADVGVVGLIKDVIGVQRCREILAELITRHCVHQLAM